MVKFKVGDRVRAIDTTSYAAQVGATATVTGPGDLRYAEVNVEWDRNGMDRGQMDGGYRETMFELIPANPLADLNVGDKFTLEYEVIDVLTSGYYVHPKGAPSIARRLISTDSGYEPESVVRKSVEPAVGQIWRAGNNFDVKRRVVAIAEGFVFYMVPNNTIPYHMTIETFKKYSTYVGPAES